MNSGHLFQAIFLNSIETFVICWPTSRVYFFGVVFGFSVIIMSTSSNCIIRHICYYIWYHLYSWRWFKRCHQQMVRWAIWKMIIISFLSIRIVMFRLSFANCPNCRSFDRRSSNKSGNPRILPFEHKKDTIILKDISCLFWSSIWKRDRTIGVYIQKQYESDLIELENQNKGYLSSVMSVFIFRPYLIQFSSPDKKIETLEWRHFKCCKFWRDSKTSVLASNRDQPLRHDLMELTTAYKMAYFICL
jgi:hypothetical protein